MVNQLTRENFEKVIKENSVAVVEFYSATCKHCKKLEAGITELSEEAGNNVYFGKVLVSDELALADEYEVTSVPTLLYFKNGEIREKSIGFTHKLIIAENIKKLQRTQNRIEDIKKDKERYRTGVNRLWGIQVFFQQEH